MRKVDTKELAASFAGTLLQPGDNEYDAARSMWNAMVDRHPAIIARCASTSDVVVALKFARANNLEIGVRCGGHSIVGHPVPEDGLVIDLSAMNTVEIDPEARRARVQGGALLGALDRVAQKYGLATTAGNVSHTGVGGLTLAGGMGWLARQFGLACDNVVAFELVTADGSVLQVTETEHPDLFWGLKGGGGNFGVVTLFEFQLHPISGRAFTADFFFPADNAEIALQHWRDLLPVAPRQATLTAWTGVAGGWPFLPTELQGRQVASIGYVWVGDPEEGKKWLTVFKATLKPVGEKTGEMTYLELQSADDDTREEHGLRRYWKGHYFRELSDDALRAFLGRGLQGTSTAEETAFVPGAGIQAYGGAIADTPQEATAFDHRDAIAEVVIRARWTNPAEDEKRMGSARRYAKALEPFASGAYVNTAADDGHSGTQRVYGGDKLARLTALKDRYDPENIFHRNANIPPSGAKA